jgi:CRP-like cAMP-binding protein
MEMEIFMKYYVHYTKILKYKKGDYIFHQNEPHDGIYIIQKGEYNISTLQNNISLNSLSFNLLYSLNSYITYVSDLHKKYENPDFDKYTISNNRQYNIFILKYTYPDILGLNHFYNQKTLVNYFSAQCCSDDGVLFYIPNEIFTSMLGNDNFCKKMARTVEEKTNIFLSNISNYKKRNDIKNKDIKFDVNTKVAKNNIFTPKLKFKRTNEINKFKIIPFKSKTV